MVVKKLINSIELLIVKKAEVLDVIENPTKLIEHLHELDDLVEMYEVKNSITEQIQLLIVMAYKSLKTGRKEKRFDGHRLHTVFYGPPGVGKSRTAMCLAKIWESLGILTELHSEGETPSEEIFSEHTSRKFVEIIEKINHVRTHVIELCSMYNPSGSKKTLETIWPTAHPRWDASLNLLKDISAQTLDLVHKHGTETPTPIPAVRAPTPIGGAATSAARTPSTVSTPVPLIGTLHIRAPVPKSSIVVCSREDFIAAYSGQTAEKTKNFLMSHLGKCIIIEEAYSLCNSDKDEFGKEALSVLNRFMEDYSDQVIVVFTGYREELMKSIFTFQPGLIRRCQSSFEIKAYSAEGLASIFTNQLTRIGWVVDSSVDLVAFFVRNYESFPAFGGDTDRLALHCKLVYGGNAFDNIMDAITTSTPIEILTIVTDEILQKAFEQYQANQIKI